jgi:hypothetical protein
MPVPAFIDLFVLVCVGNACEGQLIVDRSGAVSKHAGDLTRDRHPMVRITLSRKQGL